MLYHFERTGILRLLDHTLSAAMHKSLYGVSSTEKPGLWLVGDDGVYLMSNGLPALMADETVSEGESAKLFVVYAQEADPTKLEFDTWWANKRAGFGGDDGAEFIDALDVQLMLRRMLDDAFTVILDLTPDRMILVGAIVESKRRKKLPGTGKRKKPQPRQKP